MQDIPVDISLYLADFLAEENIRDMYMANSAFFDLAMQARYRHLDLFSDLATWNEFDKGTSKSQPPRGVRDLFRISEDVYLKRIKSLQLFPQHIYNSLHHENYLARSSSSLFKRVVSTNHPSNQYPILSALNKTLAGLSLVETCVISWDKGTVSSQDISRYPIFRTAWNTFGSKLQKLVLHISHRTPLAQMLPSESEALSWNLSELEVTIFDGIDKRLAGFINALPLSRLYILQEGDDSFDNLQGDPGDFFDDLQLLPYLSNFSAENIRVTERSTRALKRFISLHSETLEHVTVLLQGINIDIPNSEIQLMDLRSFLNLKTLETNAAISLNGEVVAEVSAPFSSLQLLSLKVRARPSDMTTRFTDIQILNNIAQRFPNIEVLDVELLSLTSKFIPAVFSYSPHLRDVSLHISNMASNDQDSEEHVSAAASIQHRIHMKLEISHSRRAPIGHLLDGLSRTSLQLPSTTSFDLQIWGPFLTFDQMQIIVLLFPRLELLQLNLTCLTPAYLGLLAKALPELQHLCFRTRELSSSASWQASQSAESFLEDMQQNHPSVKSWALKTFRLRVDPFRDTDVKQYSEIFQKALPLCSVTMEI